MKVKTIFLPIFVILLAAFIPYADLGKTTNHTKNPTVEYNRWDDPANMDLKPADNTANSETEMVEYQTEIALGPETSLRINHRYFAEGLTYRRVAAGIERGGGFPLAFCFETIGMRNNTKVQNFVVKIQLKNINSDLKIVWNE